MSWNCAIHTISWKNRSLSQILSEAEQAGYLGVELFQHPDELGGVEGIESAFLKSSVKLVGVACGSFSERCNLVRELAVRKNLPLGDPSLPYVYCDEWNERVPDFRSAVSQGFRIGLHPHMYKPIQTFQEATAILDANPCVGFLPDTAHLQVAGEDPADVVKRLSSRLIGVHLKSWREDVGRSYQFYARGFCELGEGDVNVEAVLRVLNIVGFHGWLIVEQDSTTTPLESAKRSREWLRRIETSIRSNGTIA